MGNALRFRRTIQMLDRSSPRVGWKVLQAIFSTMSCTPFLRGSDSHMTASEGRLPINFGTQTTFVGIRYCIPSTVVAPSNQWRIEMKALFIALVLASAPMPVCAQSYAAFGTTLMQPTTGPLGGPSQAGNSALTEGSHLTPTMQRQKLQWAMRLRAEAIRLQAEDGGELTDDHKRFIQTQSRKILSYSSQPGEGTRTPRFRY